MYTPEDCVNFATEFYEPSLAQVVRYDRNIYTFSAAGLQTAALGMSGLLANKGCIRLICRHKVTPKIHTAIVAGSQQTETGLRQACRQGESNTSRASFRAICLAVGWVPNSLPHATKGSG